MVKVCLEIPEIKTRVELFRVDVSPSLKKELGQAIQGEINYNGMVYAFGGLRKRKRHE